MFQTKLILIFPKFVSFLVNGIHRLIIQRSDQIYPWVLKEQNLSQANRNLNHSSTTRLSKERQRLISLSRTQFPQLQQGMKVRAAQGFCVPKINLAVCKTPLLILYKWFLLLLAFHDSNLPSSMILANFSKTHFLFSLESSVGANYFWRHTVSIQFNTNIPI